MALMQQGNAAAGDDSATMPYFCRACAMRKARRYDYPAHPWVRCDSCGEALAIDEQKIALARLQFEERSRVGSAEFPSLPRPAASANSPSAASATVEPELMTIPEVARLLRRFVKGTYRLAVSGLVPGAAKVGGRWTVRRSELLRSHVEGRVPPGRSRR